AECRRAFALAPKSAPTQFVLASAVQTKNQGLEGTAETRGTVHRSPVSAAAYIELASAALQDQGKHEEALAHSRKAVELEPRNAHARVLLGAALRAAEELEAAAVQFRQAIKLDPRNAQAHFRLGATLQALMQEEEAIAVSRRAVE